VPSHPGRVAEPVFSWWDWTSRRAAERHPASRSSATSRPPPSPSPVASPPPPGARSRAPRTLRSRLARWGEVAQRCPYGCSGGCGMERGAGGPVSTFSGLPTSAPRGPLPVPFPHRTEARRRPNVQVGGSGAVVAARVREKGAPAADGVAGRLVCASLRSVAAGRAPPFHRVRRSRRFPSESRGASGGLRGHPHLQARGLIPPLVDRGSCAFPARAAAPRWSPRSRGEWPAPGSPRAAAAAWRSGPRERERRRRAPASGGGSWSRGRASARGARGRAARPPRERRGKEIAGPPDASQRWPGVSIKPGAVRDEASCGPAPA
jgi:hypothetical protein